MGLRGSHSRLLLIVPAGWERAGCFPCPPHSSIYHSPQWRHSGAGTLRFKVNPFKRLGLCYLVRSMCSVTTSSSSNLARRETVTECLIDFLEGGGLKSCMLEMFQFFVLFFLNNNLESFYVSSVSSLQQLSYLWECFTLRCFQGDFPAVWSSPTHTSPPTKTLHLVNIIKQQHFVCGVKTSWSLWFYLFIYFKKLCFLFFTFLNPSAGC